MKKLFGFLLSLAFSPLLAATSAIYLHHERSTQATTEADCQNREICLDKTNLAPLGRFNDGTLFHVVSQEKPNVSLTGTLGVTGATTLLNTLNVSLLTTLGVVSASGKITGSDSVVATLGLRIGSDTRIYRPSTHMLKTDDSLTVAGKIGIGGAPGAEFHINKSKSGGAPMAWVENTSNTASSDAQILSIVGGSSAGDPYFGSQISSGQKYAWGIRNSVTGDPWRLCAGADLSVTPCIEYTSAGNTTFPGTLGVTGAVTATGGLTLGASFTDKTTTLTGNTTLSSAYSTIFADATGGAFAVTLPTAVGNAGLTYSIYKKDQTANAVTIATTSAQTIGPLAGWSMHGGALESSLRIISDGANWQILGAHETGTFTFSLTGVTVGGSFSGFWTTDGLSITLILDPTASGTSNAATFTLTTLPVGIRPPHDAIKRVVVKDNGSPIGAYADIGTTGVITFATEVATGTPVTFNNNGFTSSGAKGLNPGGDARLVMTYNAF